MDVHSCCGFVSFSIANQQDFHVVFELKTAVQAVITKRLGNIVVDMSNFPGFHGFSRTQFSVVGWTKLKTSTQAPWTTRPETGQPACSWTKMFLLVRKLLVFERYYSCHCFSSFPMRQPSQMYRPCQTNHHTRSPGNEVAGPGHDEPRSLVSTHILARSRGQWRLMIANSTCGKLV